MSLLFWRGGNIPEPIYRMLPVIYLAVGGWVFAVGEGFLAFLSGTLLWLAAVLILIWRRDARLMRTAKPRAAR